MRITGAVEPATVSGCDVERDPIPYALETDWPVGAAGFETLQTGFAKTLSSGREHAHLACEVIVPSLNEVPDNR